MRTIPYRSASPRYQQAANTERINKAHEPSAKHTIDPVGHKIDRNRFDRIIFSSSAPHLLTQPSHSKGARTLNAIQAGLPGRCYKSSQAEGIPNGQQRKEKKEGKTIPDAIQGTSRGRTPIDFCRKLA